MIETFDGEIINSQIDEVLNDTEITEEIILSSEEGSEILDPLFDSEDSTQHIEYILVQPYSTQEDVAAASDQVDYSSTLSCILIFVVSIFCFILVTRFRR